MSERLGDVMGFRTTRRANWLKCQLRELVDDPDGSHQCHLCVMKSWSHGEVYRAKQTCPNRSTQNTQSGIASKRCSPASRIS